MAFADRGALGLLAVAALALGVRFAWDVRTPHNPGWRVYRGEAGELLWTGDLGVAEGSDLGSGGATGARVGGRLGLLLGTRLDPAAADFEDWLVLPGVGEKTAAEILSARARLGGFSTTADILEAKGIGPKKLEKLSPWLKAL